MFLFVSFKYKFLQKKQIELLKWIWYNIDNADYRYFSI